MGIFEVNPNMQNLIAYSFDLRGSERYTLRIRDTNTGADLNLSLPEIYYSVRWAELDHGGGIKSQWLFFNILNDTYGVPMAVQSVCVYSCMDDTFRIPQILYTEPDISFTVELVVGQITSELHLLVPNGQSWRLKRVISRQPGIRYDLDHSNGSFYMRTNAGGPNFAVAQISLDRLTFDNPNGDLIPHSMLSTHNLGISAVVPHSPRQFIEKIEAFSSHLVVWVWEDGLRQIRVANLSGEPLLFTKMQFHRPDWPNTQVYSLLPGTVAYIEERLNRRSTAEYFVFTKSSFLEPRQVYCARFDSLEPVPLYQFSAAAIDAAQYYQFRLWAEPLDRDTQDIRIPLSIVSRKQQETRPDITPQPALLLSYGAYGGFIETEFSADWFPLLDRGILIAVCHPRGDADMGGDWYQVGFEIVLSKRAQTELQLNPMLPTQQGKFDDKSNTFKDTRACLKALVDLGAGGLIAGNAISWKQDGVGAAADAIVGMVPFIDPIHDLIDPSVPWTAFEWFEWGNPANKTIFDAMLAYSPYENIATGSQPAVMLTAGIQDPRVPFWEPIKYAAKLRRHKTNEGIGTTNASNQAAAAALATTPLLLRVYEAGHFESMDSRARAEELADWYTFIIAQIIGD
eukprot:jgi/Hompol1/3628/HPOL_003308-RA